MAVRPIRSIESISVVLILATALSCQDATSSSLLTDLRVRLTSQLGEKRDFFEGEPVYIVFSLSNHGSDTAWVMPFSFSAWSLDGDVRDSVGNELSKWGVIAHYLYPSGYRGEPLAPGKSLYQVQLIQNRWGVYSPETRNLYSSHHLPAGRYTLRMHFNSNLPGRRLTSRVFDAEPITFRIRARTAAEEQSFQRLTALMELFFTQDTTQRAVVGDSLMANVQGRPRDDPIVPLLTAGLWWAAVGYPQDSSRLDAFVNISSAAARAQRRTAAGAYAVLGLKDMNPVALHALAQELAGSLAGAVAASVLER